MPKVAEEEFKYGVEDFAKEADVAPATARVMLRNNNIKKSGKSYGWKTQADVKAAVAKCRGSNAKVAPTKKVAKKAEVKKVAKKVAPVKKAVKKTARKSPAKEAEQAGSEE